MQSSACSPRSAHVGQSTSERQETSIISAGVLSASSNQRDRDSSHRIHGQGSPRAGEGRPAAEATEPTPGTSRTPSVHDPTPSSSDL
eukprot:3144851-Pyramimonas_sp.AAC.1